MQDTIISTDGIGLDSEDLRELKAFKEDILKKDVRTTRHLKSDSLKEMHLNEGASQERIEDLTHKCAGEYTALSDRKHPYKSGHVWTFAEDEFIRKNYMHLSDNTIGLALCIPGRVVMHRRQKLGLRKGQVKELNKIIVWCKRMDFDTVCAEQVLTKAR